MCIKSEFKEICLKLATNGRSDKGFLLTSKVCPQGVFCPCPGAIHMYKIIKNVYKIRFQRDNFETCNIWAKGKGLSVVIKILSPMDYLPLPRAIYIWWNMKTMYIKSDFKAIFFKAATNGQSDKGFPLTSKVCPQGVVSPCPGAIYIYKIIKNLYRIRFGFLNLQQMGKGIRAFYWHQKFVPKGLYAFAPGLFIYIKSLKMCIKSDFEEIILKLATNGQSNKGFHLIINICPQGVICSFPGAIYMYKSIKIYTRTRCQVSIYRNSGPLVRYVVHKFKMLNYQNISKGNKSVKILRNSR